MEESSKTKPPPATKGGKGYKRDYDGLLSRVSGSWSELSRQIVLNGWEEAGLIPLQKRDEADLVLTPEFKQWLC